MKQKFSFQKGYRGRAIFSIFNFLFFAIVTIAMLLPIWKVCVDSVSSKTSSTEISLWPKGAYTDEEIAAAGIDKSKMGSLTDKQVQEYTLDYSKRNEYTEEEYAILGLEKADMIADTLSETDFNKKACLNGKNRTEYTDEQLKLLGIDREDLGEYADGDLEAAGLTDTSVRKGNTTLEAYKIIFTKATLWHPFWVSIYTTAIGTFLGLLISTIGAYILIQRDMPGVKIFGWLFMFTMIFNGGLVPTFLVIVDLGLYDTVWSVIFTLGMNVYNLVLMRSFFEQLPASLFEAAEIDGCSPFGIFIKIVLPLSKPAIASIGLFFAVAYWSEYFHYVLYVTSQDNNNFQVKLRELVLTDEPIAEAKDAGLGSEIIKNAAIIVNVLPFVIIYPFCQKYFVTGVTLGAVKE